MPRLSQATESYFYKDAGEEMHVIKRKCFCVVKHITIDVMRAETESPIQCSHMGCQVESGWRLVHVV